MSLRPAWVPALAGTALAGTAPAGTALAGTALAGTALAGTALAGTALAGTALAGTAPAGTALAGTALAGTALAGTALAGTALAGTALAGTAPAGTALAGTAPRRAVILAGGVAQPAAFVRAEVRPTDLLVAADAGARMALEAGLRCHLVLGDFDSLASSDLARLPADTPLWRHPPAKDESDLELALREVARVGVQEVVVLGGLGGRVDHLLVNVGLLHLGADLGLTVRLLSAQEEVRLVTDAHGALTLAWPVGRLVSLVPLSPTVLGVTLEGFRWPLDGACLRWGTSRGLSNVLETSPGRVTVREGRLLVIGATTDLSCET